MDVSELMERLVARFASVHGAGLAGVNLSTIGYRMRSCRLIFDGGRETTFSYESASREKVPLTLRVPAQNPRKHTTIEVCDADREASPIRFKT